MCTKNKNGQKNIQWKQLDTQKSVNSNNMRVVKEHSTKPTAIMYLLLYDGDISVVINKQLNLALFRFVLFLLFEPEKKIVIQFSCKTAQNFNSVILAFPLTNACNRVLK